MQRDIRVMKARRNGKVSCNHFVLVGQQIVKRKGGQWICVTCAIARNAYPKPKA